MAFVRMKGRYGGTFLVHESRVSAHEARGFLLAPEEPTVEKVTGLDEVIDDLHPTTEQMGEALAADEADKAPAPKRTRRKS